MTTGTSAPSSTVTPSSAQGTTSSSAAGASSLDSSSAGATSFTPSSSATASSSVAGSSSVGGSSSAGAASSSSGGPTCSPVDPLNGTPIAAPLNVWTWVPVNGAVCRNGSATGIGVRINPASTRLLIYLEGGGACFNNISCSGNPSSFGANNFSTWAANYGSVGIFDANNVNNPARDFNMVYIPYCTGDVHSGSQTGITVPGPGSPSNQSFVGYTNVGLAMSRIIPTFPGVTQVLLTGASAGGFGALVNYDRVAQDFCPTPVTLLDDSGPPMSDAYLAPCLQQRWRNLWGLTQAIPSNCPQATQPNGGGIINAISCLAQKYPDGRLSILSSTQDSVITAFYGFGQNNCANVDGFAAPLPGASYTAGLNDLRTNFMMPSPAWGSYYIPGTTHTFIINNNTWNNTQVGGVPLTTFVDDILNGTGAVSHVGP